MTSLEHPEPARAHFDLENVVRLLRSGMRTAVFGIVPVAGLIVTLWVERRGIAYDMHHAFRPAAEAVLNGRSPYPTPTLDALATRTAWVYLPFASFLFLPFALVPPLAADLISMALVAAAGAAALWVLGIRDGRCFGIALLTMPVLSGIQTANLTLPLALALAGVWATRSRRFVPGLLLALTLATKLFLWPVLVWFVATRRYRGAACAVAGTVLLVVGGWAALGFAGAREYPEILRLLSVALERDSYTPFALARDLHASEHIARAIGLGLASAVLVGCWIYGRRGDDVRSFTLAIVASLLFTPIVWLHYFALLFVPVAIVQRRLSPLWSLPLVLWLFAEGHGNGSTAQTAFVLLAFATLVTLTLRAAARGAAEDEGYDAFGVIRAKMRKFGWPSGSSKNSGLTQPSSPVRLS